jgi:hypothetical protein
MKHFILSLLFSLSLLSLSVLAQSEPVVGLKNFRSFYYSLISVTGVKPTPAINKHYKELMTRLPKDGRIDEFSGQTAMAAKDIAGLFCQEFAKTYQAPADTNAMFSDLSNRFYQRPMSVEEAKTLTALVGSLKSGTNKTFMVCTAMLASIDFLVQK